MKIAAVSLGLVGLAFFGVHPLAIVLIAFVGFNAAAV